MSNQFCPHCNALRDMVLSTYEKDEKVDKENLVKIITNNYHCSICNSFVYSTDVKIPKEN
ncbi:hypothetical protein LGL55_15890 [Clostridium tagluense]|uniref:hypothetical protein n=1 Tax=Clostridium TaxID=1485 RepID=UPI0013E935DB|nr:MULTISPECIES: hypothetical protein [Clostridium]MBW9159114.1 hypothetical protein [Clostridium tagluense]MBZ9626286.1 hypothetical protein [Clostridium sp. FP2]MCB2312754.1 hypothetical protein [Clostridium tagluense]MCB2317520.1 hypothetical protein [Clostridium tagluense]MCB2322247.1 hypothetical protein [Clostridium tagluense]